MKNGLPHEHVSVLCGFPNYQEEKIKITHSQMHFAHTTAIKNSCRGSIDRTTNDH